MLIFRNAEGVHGKKKVGNPCNKTKDYAITPGNSWRALALWRWAALQVMGINSPELLLVFKQVSRRLCTVAQLGILFARGQSLTSSDFIL